MSSRTRAGPNPSPRARRAASSGFAASRDPRRQGRRQCAFTEQASTASDFAPSPTTSNTSTSRKRCFASRAASNPIGGSGDQNGLEVLAHLRAAIRSMWPVQPTAYRARSARYGAPLASARAPVCGSCRSPAVGTGGGVERERRVGVCPARPHLRRHPDGLHQLSFRGALAQGGLGAASDAVRALCDVGDRDSDSTAWSWSPVPRRRRPAC